MSDTFGIASNRVAIQRDGGRGVLLRDCFEDGKFVRVEAWLHDEKRWQEFPENGLIPKGAFNEPAS